MRLWTTLVLQLGVHAQRYYQQRPELLPCFKRGVTDLGSSTVLEPGLFSADGKIHLYPAFWIENKIGLVKKEDTGDIASVVAFGKIKDVMSKR